MPFRGRLSTACERCRQRRLNCNRAVPSCGSCTRADVECTGYRNPLDLSFLDESAVVVARANQRPSKKKLTKRPGIPPPGVCQSVQVVAAVAPCLVYSVEETARCYLIANFMQSNRNSDLSYLLPVIETSPKHSAIEAAVNAVALATWANVRLSPKAMLKAQSEYTIALAETNKALRSNVCCKKDETLALVVLLSIYEVIACTDEAFVGRWMAHLEGATQLIELRGPEQLTRVEGLSLFTHLRAQISLSSIFQEKPSPPILARLTEDAAAYRSPDCAVLDRLSAVVTDLADFCAEVKTNPEYHHKDIICEAMRLDTDLFLTVLDAPKRWHYRSLTVPLEDGKPIINGIWGREYHEYDSLGAANLWNNYRAARIVIQELIIDIVQDRDLLADTQYAFLANQCRQTLKRIVEDICASVPFYFGWCLPADDEESVGRRSIEGPGNNGLALMWPILVAGNSGLASAEQKEWIAVCLDKIGHSMGINQAFSMARLLRERKRSRSLLTT